MTRAAQGDRANLVVAGVAAASVPWRGGDAMFMIDGFAAESATLELQTPSGAWVTVWAPGYGSIAAETEAFAIFVPLCAGLYRVTGAGGGAVNAYLIGV